MSMGQAGGKVSLQLGTGPAPAVSPVADFIKIASGRTFPLVLVKVTKDNSVDDATVEVRVNEKVHELVNKHINTDNLMFYFDTTMGVIGQWDSDMMAVLRTMKNLDVFPDIDRWIMESRRRMSGFSDNAGADGVLPDSKALDNLEKLAGVLGISEELEQIDMFSSTACDVLRENTLDTGTMIYRMAMAIYHSGRMAGTSILRAIDDPGSAYISLINSDVYASDDSKFAPIMSIPLESRVHAVRVLIAFTAACYVYHVAIGDGR